MSINWPKNNLDAESQAWRRKAEEEVDDLRREVGILRANGKATARAVSSSRSAINRAGLDISDQQNQIEQGARTPAAPANPAASSDAYFDEYGYPRAKVFGSCDEVTVDTNGQPVGIARYELAGRLNEAGQSWAIVAETPAVNGQTPQLEAQGLPAGEEWAFKLRAVSSTGIAGEYSGEIVVVLAKDEEPPIVPYAPAGESRLGQVKVWWNGALNDGGSPVAPPPDFSHVEVMRALSATAPAISMGRVTQAFEVFVAPDIPYNTPSWYSLVAVDFAGNRSAESPRTELFTVPLVDTDVIGRVIDGANVKLDSIQEEVIAAGAVTEEKISQEVNDKIAQAVTDAANASLDADAALTAANGKNKVVFSTSAASGTAGYTAGDVWFQRSGSQIIAQWEFTTSWQSRTLTDSVITNLNAGTITAGTLNADRIGANTITTEKLLVTNLNNLLDNPGFEFDAVWNMNAVASYYTGSEARTGNRCLRVETSGSLVTAVAQHPVIQVEGGETYTFSFWARTASGTSNAGSFRPRVRAGTTPSVNVLISGGSGFEGQVTTDWQEFHWTVQIPSGLKFMRVEMRQEASATGTIYVDDVSLLRRADGKLIVDGVVTADKLAANAVTAAKIEAGAVTAGKIAANSIGAAEIIANSITANELAANSVTASEVSTNAIFAGAIQANAVTADKIAAGSVTTVKLDALAVTADKIAANAITADKIQANAINGMTITGALVRSASSGARTELNSSGLRVLNSSNQELVKLGYGITTGMEVRNPSTGTMFPLANVAFGSSSAQDNAAQSLALNPNAVGNYTRHSGDNLTLTFTAPSSGGVLSWGQIWLFNSGTFGTQSPVFYIQPRINGSPLTASAGATNYPVYASGSPRGMSPSVLEDWEFNASTSASISTTPGATYTVQLWFRVITGAMSASTCYLSNRFISFQPSY